MFAMLGLSSATKVQHKVKEVKINNIEHFKSISKL